VAGRFGHFFQNLNQKCFVEARRYGASCKVIKRISLADLSIANLTVGGGDPVALVEAASESGFGAIGLLLRTALNQPLSHEIVGQPQVIRTIRATCAAAGVKIFDVESFVLRPGTDAASFRSALEVGTWLGAKYISCVGTELFGSDRLLSMQERVDLFGALCDEAFSFGLHVGLEFMRYRDIPDLDAALNLIEKTGRQNSGIVLDVLHFYRTDGTPQKLKSLCPSSIAYVQLSDARAAAPALQNLPVEARSGRLHLGDGDIPLDALLDVVPEDTPLAIETPVAADASLSIREKVASTARRTRCFFVRREATA
jgi:sugar phosphate isomerase/epimerase